MAEAGRRAGDLRFFQGLSFVIGSTEAEARLRADELDEYLDDDAIIAHAAGGIGVDLGHYDLDTPIGDIESEGSRSHLLWLREAVPDREPTVRDLARLRTRNSRVVGTPEQIADRLDEWRAAGVDGINVMNYTIPAATWSSSSTSRRCCGTAGWRNGSTPPHHPPQDHRRRPARRAPPGRRLPGRVLLTARTHRIPRRSAADPSNGEEPK
ncbi:hypothetical protein GCM10020366_07660 [Saccharopolyspora gregorii]|uniref:Luciferase-like domain-containing protein n=1 Tax=Saccharopolyspora gregorii TaxID=33914 RepID=A0ABP6RLC8_9PSEU